MRWLRPEFQDPALRAAKAASEGKALSNQELEAKNLSALQPDLAMEMPIPEPRAAQAPKAANGQKPARATGTPASPAAAGTEPQAWPAALPEQVRAVAAVLAASKAAMPLAALEAHFKGRDPWKKSLPRILETLEALGRAKRETAHGEEQWRAG